MTFAWLLLALALPRPNGERRYRILVDGREDGAAALSIRALPSGSFDYRWRSQIGVSRSPCLWSEEQRGGTYTVGHGRPLPDELALSFLPADAKGEVAATINGQKIRATIGRDGLPDRVDLPEIGLSYVAAGPGAPGWDRCSSSALERGPELAGAEALGDPRRVRRATFARVESPDGWRLEVAAPGGPLPDLAGRLVAQAYARAPGRDCKVVAFELARALERAGFRSCVAAGWIVARGALWPHAWTELEEGQEFRALDATTSSGWADAARIRLGTLDSAEDAWKTGDRLLRERHARIRLVDFDLFR